ncbi:MAG: hypothetical protein HC802_04650 [Caldilineaceae bacterium]|nr:hypothetical protein [Caldilineaceae bacterium]
MKRLIVVVLLVFVAVGAWRIGSRLSADALGMGVGLVFGVLAGVPTALLVMASGRRRDEPGSRGSRMGHEQNPHGLPMYGGYPQQAPVIVLTGNAAPGGMVQAGPGQYGANPGYPALPDRSQMAPREYRVVGEKDEWVDDY